jgi:hypothetical protein
MNNMSVRRNWLPTYIAIGLTVLVGCVNLIDVRLSLVLVIGLTAMFVLYLKPPYALAALVLLAPFSGTILIGEKFGGIPGLKIINLVLLAVFMAFLLSKRRFRVTGPEIVFIFGSILLLAISVVRSIPHLHILNLYFQETMGTGKYLVSGLVKPIFYLLPFLVIAGYMRGRNDVDFMTRCFKYSMLILSVCVLTFYLVEIPNKTNFDYVRYAFGQFFGMHTNGLSDFYILGYPIVLAWFVYKKNTFNAINLILALGSVAVLYSRTAYVLIVFSTILFLVLDKKKKLLPVVLLLGICAVFIAPDTVIDRGLTGIEDRNLQTFSAGRVENIWMPLVNDIKGDPKKLLVGSGRHAIIHSSPIWKGHAHNMYLTTFLDTGIVGLSFFVAFFVYFLRGIRNGMREVPEGKYRTLLTGTLVSIVAYLISGMTGREFFPEMSNSYLWISLAIALNIIKMHQQERTLPHEV